jgi:hypothetical protein
LYHGVPAHEPSNSFYVATLPSHYVQALSINRLLSHKSNSQAQTAPMTGYATNHGEDGDGMFTMLREKVFLPGSGALKSYHAAPQ